MLGGVDVVPDSNIMAIHVVGYIPLHIGISKYNQLEHGRLQLDHENLHCQYVLASAV